MPTNSDPPPSQPHAPSAWHPSQSAAHRTAPPHRSSLRFSQSAPLKVYSPSAAYSAHRYAESISSIAIPPTSPPPHSHLLIPDAANPRGSSDQILPWSS